jgi:hypothetical protein
MLARPRLDELAAPKRNHYFYGKLLDEMHLRLEQNYFNGKRALLNRLALGAGVLCGLRVEPDGKFVKVSAGVAIDGFGREIIVPESLRLDPAKISGPCGTTRDRAAAEKTIYLKLCYRECKTDFEPALVSDCLPQQQCAPSTIVESYCLELGVDAPPPPPAHNEALCKALHDGQTPEAKRDLVNAELAKTCGKVVGDGCIALATIHLDDGGNVTDTKFDPPQHVYSNAALFDMLLCLGEGGKGAPGDPGIGLDQDLPKILDIGWKHRDLQYMLQNKSDPGNFLRPFLEVGGSGAATEEVLKKRIIDGQNVPPFTIYFNRKLTGIDAQTFTVRLQYEVMLLLNGQWVRPGFYLELPLAGNILSVDGDDQSTTPHTKEVYAHAVSFIPRPESLAIFLVFTALALQQKLASRDDRTRGFVTFQVGLKGDFLWASDGDPAAEFKETLALDADNIAGLVGTDRTRDPNYIHGGKNPSGNLTQGGDFESWMQLAYMSLDQAETPPPITVEPNVRGRPRGAVPESPGFLSSARAESMAVAAAAFTVNPSAMPVSVNLGSAAQLQAAGFSPPQTERILEARRKQWFADEDDFLKRGRIKATELKPIADKILFL